MILDTLRLINQSVLLLTLALLCLLGTSLVWAVLQFLRLRRTGMAREIELLSRPLPDDDHLPHVLVQVPTFNEGRVISRIAQAVGNPHWPPDRLHIQSLDDSTDRSSAEVAEEGMALLRSRGIDAVMLHRTDRNGFKGGAMQSGLQHSHHEHL